MMRKLNQIAAAVAIGLAGASVPAGAAVLGGAGEALLVPLAVWSGGTLSNFTDPNNIHYTPAVDTLIEVWVPGAVGWDAVPNNFVAVHSTPTFSPTALSKDGFSDPDLQPPAAPAIHWYWFDQRSVEMSSGTIPVTPNDVVQISVTEIADGSFENVPGYFVIVNQDATDGSAATFSMFGNAWLTGAVHFTPPNPSSPQPSIDLGIGFPLIGGSIPVLAMNDGVDANPLDVIPGATYPVPTSGDSVKYSGGVPYGLSPLVSGFRSNRSDGTPDTAVFDLALSNRLVSTIQVVWVDHNLGDNASAGPFSIAELYPTNTGFVTPSVSLQVYDTDEQACNGSIQLPDELNVIWIPPAFERAVNGPWQFWNRPFEWATQTKVLCIPRANQADDSALSQAGFVQYKVHEYIDTNNDRPEAAMFGFSIKVDGGFVSNDGFDTDIPEAFVLMLETSLGHDRGTFKNAASPASGN
jgi:hypothetical protein